MINQQEFEQDFNKLCAMMSTIRAKHNLPPSALVLHPAWEAPVKRMLNPQSMYHNNQLTNFGVRIEFGILRTERVATIIR